ncbi:hypothetical protein Tco_1124675 [Tanacetum coccineum]|uniref:Uncharacterized protein n=1 Tax=Tanacetum coccineum TaxID=301880 RepID=A0ABQ5J896_9ASTR
MHRLNTPIIDECHIVWKLEQQIHNGKKLKHARYVSIVRNPTTLSSHRLRVCSRNVSITFQQHALLGGSTPSAGPEQEATTGPSIPTRLDSSTSQAIQLPELGLNLTPTIGHELSHEINNHSAPTLISQALGPSRKRSRSPSSPFYPDATAFSDGKPASETPELNPKDVTARLEDIEVGIDTLHADTEDKELLISELQDSLTAAENEISLLQIRVADVEDRRAKDHDQIKIILARLGL